MPARRRRSVSPARSKPGARVGGAGDAYEVPRMPSRRRFDLWFPTAAGIDVWLSALVAAMPVGPLDKVLFIPGHMFGAPLCTLAAIPCALATVADPMTSPAAVALSTLGMTAFGFAPLLLVARGNLPPAAFHKGRHIGLAAVVSICGLY